MQAAEVVITGVGVVSPVGIGKQAFWESLVAGQCGLGPVTRVNMTGMPPQIAGEVRNFDPRTFVVNRKSLKVMSRDAQLAIAASTLACQDAGIAGKIQPERFGAVLGADQICSFIDESEAAYSACFVDGRFDYGLWGTKGMSASFPLGFLRVLPNMVTSHVTIAEDARGPSNTIHQGEISSLLAVTEAASVIQRGMADVMLVGGASSQLHPLDFVRRIVMGNLSKRSDDPAAAVRPFDAQRDGYVWSEGAASLILENRAHAEARGAKVLARLMGYGAAFATSSDGRPARDGLDRAITAAIARAGIGPADLGHVKAHGLSTVRDDAFEAAVLADLVPGVPVTAFKGHFGNAGAAGAAMELAASIMAVEKGCVPAVRNYQRPDPACPLPIVRDRPLVTAKANALCVTWMPVGQAAAVVIGN